MVPSPIHASRPIYMPLGPPHRLLPPPLLPSLNSLVRVHAGTRHLPQGAVRYPGQVTVDMSLSLATLMKTSSSVVSARPQARMLSLLFASSMARNTSEIFNPSLGTSNFCVPETRDTLFAAGEMDLASLSTSSSSPAGAVTVSTHEPPYLSFSWT